MRTRVTYPRTYTTFLILAIRDKTIGFKADGAYNHIGGQDLVNFILLERRMDIILAFLLGACFGGVITQLLKLAITLI